MNADTGKPYEGEEVERAKARGENVVPVSKRVIRMLRDARKDRLQKLRELRGQARKIAAARVKDKIAKKARKKNRRRR